MGTSGKATRNGRKPAPHRAERPDAQAAKIATALKEKKEALDQQAATAEILRGLSRASSDPQPVFQAIVEHAHRLCRAVYTILYRYDGASMTIAAYSRFSARGAEAMKRRYPGVPRRDHIVGRAILDARAQHSVDLPRDARFPVHHGDDFSKFVRRRAVLVVPLLRDGAVIGAISVGRAEADAFTKQETGLLETFAEQAVIAIEKVRLFNETKEALEQQTATAEILRVISSSPDDIQPVFASILEHAMRLCDAGLGTVGLYDGKIYTHVAQRGGSPKYVKWLFSEAFEPSAGSTLGRMIAERRPVHIPDYRELASYREGNPRAVATVELGGARTYLAIPMLREGRVLGGITIRRAEVRPFTQRQIDLVSTFANQAVIAIENVRLFNETKEALEHQQTSTDILRIVSQSVADSQPAFQAILAALGRLFAGFDATVWRVEQDRLVGVARGGPTISSTTGHSVPITPDYAHGVAILERRAVRVDDVVASREISEASRQDLLSRGRRALLIVPFVRDAESVGAISVSRTEPYRFSEKQVALLQAFASQAVIAIENARLFNETKEALERQTASADILRVISSTPTDSRPVFEAIVEAAHRLTSGKLTGLLLRQGSRFVVAGLCGSRIEDLPEQVRNAPLDREKNFPSRAILDAELVHVTDWESDGVPEHERLVAKTYRVKSGLIVPLLRKGEGIGALAVLREAAGPYHEKEIALLRSFADQAVIAIENTRLFNDTKEALERQTATAEILKVIASSPSDVQPVFDAIAASARQLLGGLTSTVTRVVGDMQHLAAFTTTGESGDETLRRLFPLRLGELNSGRAIATLAPAVRTDTETDPSISEAARENARARGWRSALAVPMVREGVAIGAISVARGMPGSFSHHQIGLLQTFADQAVIAIENVRLFNETKEALEQQTAISEVLRVISSSPADVKPMLDAVATRAARICDAGDARVYLLEGDSFRYVAGFGNVSITSASMPLDRGSPSGRAMIDRAVQHVEDILALPEEEFPRGRANALQGGWRSILSVPLLREGRALGSIVLRRKEVRPFSEKQIALLKTFADQAAIAIENVRLFNETKEALERQTATAEILRVISSSPTDVKPVFDTILSNGARLCEANFAALYLYDGEVLTVPAHQGALPELAEAFKTLRLAPSRTGAIRLAALERRIVQVADITKEPGFKPAVLQLQSARTVLGIPLLREKTLVGVLAMWRTEVRPFTDKQMALLQTFADQAVIAIENVRLFKELQSQTEALTKSVGQLTALGEVGQAISSTLDLETVLKTIVARAVQLTGLDSGSIYEYDEQAEEYHLRATENLSPEIVEVLRRAPIRKNEGPVWQAGLTGQPTQITEMRDEGYQTPRREFLLRAGYRALLAVPLMRENRIVGALTVTRKAPGAFAPEVVELLKTFATQSALAIQNARLFREIAEKGRQLEVASEHKSQFLASMSHELRTPLNALLGFNEMILGDIYGEVPGDMRPPLAQMQTSGKHLLRLINNVLDLAKIEAGRMELALADYSVQDVVDGVRSTLQPLATDKGLQFLAAVPADIPLAHGDSGRITQCLMNLAGNSLKFTRAGKVEISVAMSNGRLRYCVADTGIGIPRDKIDSLFTEFRQTDATVASEYGGTGLGLSISKKFVEMHGGRIWVESEPGRGSVFTFEVPLRAAAA